MNRLITACIAACVLAGPAHAAGGGMSLADFKASARARMMQADTDHDGKLSADEWAQAAAGRSRDPAKSFAAIDANHDGFLDQAEIDAIAARRFAKADSNGDGTLSADEQLAALAHHHGGGGGSGEGGGEQSAGSGQPGT